VRDKNNTILKVTEISKNYPGVQALDKVSFNLLEGEVHCLVGENGAGKSTLIEILAGSVIPDSGKIELFYNHEDNIFGSLTPDKSIELGIQTIHQDNKLIESMTVAENIFIRNLQSNRAGFFSLGLCFESTKDLFNSLNIEIQPNKLIEELSPAEKKMVCITKAFSEEVKILILDEPTSSLDEKGEDNLFRIIRDVTKKGISVIYISHNLDEIFDIGDRVTVLKDGKKIGTHFVKDINEDVIVKEMIGRSASTFYERKKLKAEGDKLEVKNYTREGYVYDVSFDVRRGEIFGIGGVVGSGRTDLARIIFGLDEKDSGRLVFCGKDITPKTPRDAVRNGIGYLTEDRKETGLMMMRPILENISLVKLGAERKYILNLSEERKKVTEISDKLNIITPSINQIVINLSGGNQQKVVVARWLFAISEILIFDEPTLGIDIGAKKELYNLMQELLKNGKIIIMISSDMPELVSMSDRIGIMRNCRMVKILESNEINEENILKYSIGMGNGN